MRGMLVSLAGVQSGLEEGNLEMVAVYATNIAEACDHPGATFDPALYGPAFKELDATLHQAAERLAGEARANNLDAARASYDAVANACIGCHSQAPKANRVRLGRLAQ